MIRVTVLLTSLLLGLTTWAGPQYDPFVERFQVGTFSDPDKIVYAGGYPAGLIESPTLDRLWVQTAVKLLDPGKIDANKSRLTYQFLQACLSPDDIPLWVRDQGRLLRELDGQSIGLEPSDSPFLRYERLSQAVFRNLRSGNLSMALTLAQTIDLEAEALGLSSRVVFIWELRRRLLEDLVQAKPGPTSPFWETSLKLGSFDGRNAWALWVGHRRDLGLTILAPEFTTRELGLHVGRLSKSWLGPNDLLGATWDSDLKAALGANHFSKNDLAQHLKKYSTPPANFKLQGWWVKGQRYARRGQADAYEQLARSKNIKPGWRLDVWRRASEVRLLKGQWTKGLENLDQALALSAAGHGTKSLRRRLRQWTEQAMVLALAQGDTSRARAILERGYGGFNEDELAAYKTETNYWVQKLLNTVPPLMGTDDPVLKEARRVVEQGQASRVQAVETSSYAALVTAAEKKLWDLWLKWGLALADPAAVTGQKRARCIVYREALLAATEATSEKKREAVLGVVGGRLGDRPWLHRLQLQALDYDVGQLSQWRSTPLPTPVPELVKVLRSSQLDRHALLGFALATGDMRGILAVAVDLPAEGLTREEKRRFLYPLPGPGPIRQAILAAGSEPELLLAVARNESRFEPAVRSRAGALGWMQIMPFHYREKGALPGKNNWRMPANSIAAGDRLLQENRRRYKGDPYLMLAAYNAGPGAANRWLEQLGGQAGSDIYLAWIGYPETRHYVEKVLIDREIYYWIITGQSRN